MSLTYKKIEENVAKMRRLKKNWDSYKADPPNETSIQNAINFIKLCSDFLPIKFNPTCMGGVAAFWGDKKKSVFIEFYNTGKIWYLTSENDAEDKIQTFQVKDYQLSINHIKEFLQKVNS